MSRHAFLGRAPRLVGAVLAPLVLLGGCDSQGGRQPGSGSMPRMNHTTDGGADTAGLRELPVPAEFARGRRVYDASCASCHGEAALGTDSGPPLVHVIYEPGHHADAAFLLATIRGVRAHHWGFGDMPPRPEVSREQAQEIVGYVRWLQREAGVH